MDSPGQITGQVKGRQGRIANVGVARGHLRHMLPTAGIGDPCAQCALGVMHDHSKGPEYKLSLLPKDCTIVLTGRGDSISVPFGEKYWPTLYYLRIISTRFMQGHPLFFALEFIWEKMIEEFEHGRE